MLDWLSDHQIASTSEDSQLPDAPETPAPIFAYRALKGILFGSPDYDAEDEDKENIAPAELGSGLKIASPCASRSGNVSSSPLQSKSPNSRASARDPGSPSPRKRRQLSPTKSILRTPGLPTPRRQNVNVTFKDVRPSVSPSTVTTRLFAAQNEAKAARLTEGKISSTAKTTQDGPAVDVKAREVAEKLPISVYDLTSVDAYRKSTEREMKQLVRYSQRMREYARLSQQENMALRKERDELKRELEEMRKMGTERRGISDKQVRSDESDIKAAGPRRDHGIAGGKRWRESDSEARCPVKIHTGKHTGKAGGSLKRTASSSDSRTGEPRIELGEEKMDQKKAESVPTQDKGLVRGVVSMKRAATTAQLPPDRLAAAKERLRVKSEERRRALSATVG